MNLFATLGAKLGLYRTVSVEAGAPADAALASAAAPAPAKKVISLQDLQKEAPEVPEERFASGAANSADPLAAAPKPAAPERTLVPRPLVYDFAKVYEAARVAAPPHGWTIEMVVKLLGTPQFKAMSDEQVRQAVLGLLAAEGVPPVDVVKDAIARDKAVDAFERHLRKKAAEKGAERREQIERNRREIEALQAAIGDLEKQIATCETAGAQDALDLDNWVGTVKKAKEEELAKAVRLLTSEPTISIGPAGAAPPEPPPAAARPAGPAPSADKPRKG